MITKCKIFLTETWSLHSIETWLFSQYFLSLFSVSINCIEDEKSKEKQIKFTWTYKVQNLDWPEKVSYFLFVFIIIWVQYIRFVWMLLEYEIFNTNTWTKNNSKNKVNVLIQHSHEKSIILVFNMKKYCVCVCVCGGISA